MENQMQDSKSMPTTPKKSVGRTLALIGAPVAGILALAYVFIFDPSRQTIFFIPCYFLQYTGLYCPGCGNTRALHALLHLHFLEALDHNLIFPFIATGILYLLVGEYLNVLVGRRILWLPKKVPLWIVILLVLFVAIFTVLRNLPFLPFSWLAPGL